MGEGEGPGGEGRDGRRGWFGGDRGWETEKGLLFIVSDDILSAMPKRAHDFQPRTAFAQWLVEARAARGATMQRLAAQAGLSQSYISELEHGKQPSRTVVQRLAAELRADETAGLLAAGFAQEDVKYVLHPDAVKLVEAFEGADPVGRELLLRAAEVALGRGREGAVGRRADDEEVAKEGRAQ